MRQDEYSGFVERLTGVFDVYGKERGDIAIALWWKLLEPFAFDDVEKALIAHVSTSRFAPTPADIRDLIGKQDRRPTADEAWAMIPRDERESVFWTEEMAHAYGIAAPLLEHGDQVGARRAFIDAYDSAVNRARLSHEPVKVTPSWGWDASGRYAAVQKAMQCGLLPMDKAEQFALTLGAPQPQQGTHQIGYEGN